MIDTERLRLRQLRRADVPAMVEALNDWSVAQWLARPPFPYREADAHEFLSWTRGLGEDGLAFAMADRLTDELYGVVTIDPAGDRAELGYWLNAAAGGRGFMTEAVAALLAYARPKLGGVTIFATIDPENARSERVLVKNGFQAVGRYRLETRRKRGTTDVLLFELEA